MKDNLDSVNRMERIACKEIVQYRAHELLTVVLTETIDLCAVVPNERSRLFAKQESYCEMVEMS
jgi:hypothetical protein